MSEYSPSGTWICNPVVLDMAEVSSCNTCICTGSAAPRTKSSVSVPDVVLLLGIPYAGISSAEVAARARLGETGGGAPLTECTSAVGTGSESSPSSPLNNSSKT